MPQTQCCHTRSILLDLAQSRTPRYHLEAQTNHTLRQLSCTIYSPLLPGIWVLPLLVCHKGRMLPGRCSIRCLRSYMSRWTGTLRFARLFPPAHMSGTWWVLEYLHNKRAYNVISVLLLIYNCAENRCSKLSNVTTKCTREILYNAEVVHFSSWTNQQLCNNK